MHSKLCFIVYFMSMNMCDIVLLLYVNVTERWFVTVFVTTRYHVANSLKILFLFVSIEYNLG